MMTVLTILSVHIFVVLLRPARASDNDFAFFQDILVETKCPEYNGYNTMLCRDAGMKPKTGGRSCLKNPLTRRQTEDESEKSTEDSDDDAI